MACNITLIEDIPDNKLLDYLLLKRIAAVYLQLQAWNGCTEQELIKKAQQLHPPHSDKTVSEVLGILIIKGIVEEFQGIDKDRRIKRFRLTHKGIAFYEDNKVECESCRKMLIERARRLQNNA